MPNISFPEGVLYRKVFCIVSETPLIARYCTRGGVPVRSMNPPCNNFFKLLCTVDLLLPVRDTNSAGLMSGFSLIVFSNCR